MDDSHRVCGHVAAELVPLAIALCEQRGLNGKELVTIIAAGYDPVERYTMQEGKLKSHPFAKEKSSR